jgi:hypothetical protein
MAQGGMWALLNLLLLPYAHAHGTSKAAGQLVLFLSLMQYRMPPH